METVNCTDPNAKNWRWTQSYPRTRKRPPTLDQRLTAPAPTVETHADPGTLWVAPP